MTQSVRLVVSRGRPRGLPLGPCRLEARLATRLELYDLGRARNLLRACRDPYEVETHLPLLSVVARSRRPPPSESAASEVGDELRRRGVEANDVEHPRVGRVGDREAVRDHRT